LHYSKKKQTEIIRKLDDKSVYTLSIEELCFYASYRLSKLVVGLLPMHFDEVKYRLCEVGPGRRRFDPLVLDILLSSKYFDRHIYNERLMKMGNWFVASKSGWKFREEKQEVIEKLYECACSEKLFTEIRKKINDIIVSCGYSVLNVEINTDQKYIQFIITIDEQKYLLRFYNSVTWFYPDSSQIWELIDLAGKEKCIPILIAPRIHGSCYQLFKAIGMYARSSYFYFTGKSIDTILKEKDERQIFNNNLHLGKTKLIFDVMKGEEFSNIVHILNMPKNYDEIFSRLINKIKKLNDGFLALKKSKDENINIQERMKRIKSILSMKIGRLNSVKEMVYRNENLIAELN